MLLDFILEHKDEILSIFEKYNCEDVVLIGSVSKRKEHDKSDIDFVANFDISTVEKMQMNVDLRKELKSYFNREIDLATHNQILGQYPKALSEGVRLKR